MKDKDISQIKYKTNSNSVSQSEATDHKKNSLRSEAKQPKQRWVNQHLFESSNAKERQRRNEDKENDYRYSCNVTDGLRDLGPAPGLNKREFKSHLKDQQKSIGLIP